MTLDERAAIYGPIIRKAFADAALPPEWGMALARQESAFNPKAERLTGGDGVRGGAYGLCQITLATAHGELGYLGHGAGLKDPELNARLAAKFCNILIKRFKTHELADIAAAYNSGKTYAHTNESVRINYVLPVLEYAQLYAKGSVA